jgi:hypothetical protein
VGTTCHLVTPNVQCLNQEIVNHDSDSVNVIKVAPVVPFLVVPPLKEHLPKTISTLEVVAPLKHCRWFNNQSTKDL